MEIVKVWRKRVKFRNENTARTRMEDGRMGGWEDGRMGGWEDGRMGGWEDGRMGGWEDGRMERGNEKGLEKSDTNQTKIRHKSELLFQFVQSSLEAPSFDWAVL
jgi:hypothetical protein